MDRIPEAAERPIPAFLRKSAPVTVAEFAQGCADIGAEFRTATAAITVPHVTRRCIRSTGREFEEGFRCDESPAAAEKAARDACARMDYMASPSVQQVSPVEWSVRWWSLD